MGPVLHKAAKKAGEMKTTLPGIYNDSDPRLSLDDNDLAEASTNRFPVVASQKRGKDGMALWGGILGSVALGGLTLYLMTSARVATNEPQEPQTPQVITENEVPVVPPGAVTLVDPEGNAQILAEGQPGLAGAPASALPAAPPFIAAVPAQVAGPSAEEVRANEARAPALILDQYADRSRRSGSGAAGAGETRNTPVGLNNDELFALGASESAGGTAVAMANPSATIVEGTLIPAVLETAINSDLPGFTRAFVSQDVRSFDNKTVLLPRGSRLIGQYKSGVSAGQTRAYVIWTRVIRPDGVSIELGSPGTDMAGETGLPGKVNSHFFKRFGAAILLSVVGALGGTSNNGVVIASGTSAASVAAQSNANIPPTIRVGQGQPIKIFVARDLDFAEVTATAL